MKILDHVTLIVLLHLIYNLNHVDSSFEDSIEEMGDTHELDESRAERFHHHHHHLRHRKGHPHDYDTDDYDNCDCTCSKCEAPSPCCNNVCRSCASNMYQQQATGLSGQSQASVVFVPFPYPLMMASPMMKSTNHHTVMLAHHETTHESNTQSTTTPAQTTTTTTPTTTTETTTSAATSTTTANCSYSSNPINPPYLKSQNNENVLDSVLKSVVDDYTNIIVKTPEKLRNGNNKYMLTSLRRTKPTWMPKFGIVPITDDMAVKLMSQLKARYPIRTQKRPVHDQH
ncbi:hypothetical protein HF086_015369 [Spodoptera exigua]|uniref:Uncharacterized protein n=1 Tax=Spodoptera exigua TaxID=7107 RepID=A0A922M0M6_SPOEX|nr:hypothetical protein HF086_015369 [Spodoptera exigua]